MLRRILPLCCCLLLTSCGAPPSPMRPKPAGAAPAGAARRDEVLGALLPAYEFARVEPGTYGPVSISLDAGTLSVWASPGPKERVWRARVLDRDGHASSAPLVIGKTSLELGLVTLAPVSQGLRGLLVYSTQPSEQSTTLHALLLDPSGAARAPVVELVSMGSTLLWTQIVDTGPGPMVFYAVARDDRAEVRVVGLTPAGAIRFADRQIVGELRAWQVVAAPDGAALAVVRTTNYGHGGVVSLLLLDHTGAQVREPIDLSDRPTAELDLDMTRVGRNYVLAWSDRQRIDSRILLAAVDPIGTIVTPPRPGVAAVGEQSLIRLVPPVKGGRAVLLWETPAMPFPRRMLSLAEVDEQAKAGQRIVHLACSSQSNTLPEVIAVEDGIRALTFDDFVGVAGNETAEPMPTFVELGPELSPRSAVPLTLAAAQGKTAVPLLAWGLDCRHGCRATAALDDSPVTIATIPLSDAARRPRASELVRALVATDSATLPRIEHLGSVVEVEPLADLAAVQTKAGFLVAAVTYFDPSTPLKRLPKPGPDGRTDPLQARIDIFPIGPEGDALTAQTVSYRANSLPGLSLATGRTQALDHGIAWSAVDQGQPQLFMSLVGDDAKKRAQRMLTHKRGRLDEVALAATGDGWLAAWADERTNSPELYASRFTQSLERRGGEQRLTDGHGEISALALVPMRDDAIVVFAASRRSSQKHGVELFTRRISLASAQPLDAGQRIVDLAGSIRFLSATNHEEGVVLGWLESPPNSGLVDGNPALCAMRLDAKGRAVSQVIQVPLSNAVPASIAVDCPNNRCHGIVVADVGGRGELQGFNFDPKAASVPKLIPLARSLGTVEQNVAPVLIGDHVFMVDQIDAERTRIVHAKLIWE